MSFLSSPSVPKQVEPAPIATIDEGTAVREEEDRLAKRRGRASTILASRQESGARRLLGD